jgi:ABC-type phosphate transport system substrate-binding protein
MDRPSGYTKMLKDVLVKFSVEARSSVLSKLNDWGSGAAKISAETKADKYFKDTTAPQIRVATPDAVLGSVLNNVWSIGYTSLSNIRQANRDVGIAAIENSAGKFVSCSVEAVSSDPHKV